MATIFSIATSQTYPCVTILYWNPNRFPIQDEPFTLKAKGQLSVNLFACHLV